MARADPAPIDESTPMSNVHALHPEPTPRPVVPVQGFAADYPVASLGPLREVVEAVQGISQAPAALAAHSALAIASLAVQGHANVETLGGPRPLSLYFLTIAASGERKSTCDALLSSSLPYGLTVTEATVDGLFRSLRETPSLGLLSDEGGQFLGGYAMAGQNQQRTLAVFNDLWQGKTIRTARKATRDSVELAGRRLAVHLMVQPTMVRKLFAAPLAVGSGFLPRFLICEPRSMIGTRLHANTVSNEAPIAAFNDRLKAVLSATLPIPDLETGILAPRTLRLSDDARRLLIEWSDMIEQLQAPGRIYSVHAGYASKTAEQAARLAGVLALWRDLGATEVSGKDMTHGFSLANYYISEVARAAGHASLDADLVLAESLRCWLLGRPGAHFLTGEVIQGALSREIRDKRTAERLLGILADHGWVQKLPAGTVVDGAARTSAWRLTVR
ncbi:DUF3987 domain-containing protein [Paracoccus sp. S-4012]|uniref:DUF3987 domain-containing protein n=1 Tax=Paracoccus sp. S-4012 TaxID=2665648 RepID=UPI0012B01865|nr:DUF3987 domain-containing protein [Paracoccus sp. S-4012]MRX50445.1 DUF3987 domain-containing protein [Paracoccus sp. S-4012]